MRHVRQAALAVLVTAAACSQPRPAMRPPAPERFTAWGDTSRFGENAITAVDAQARYVALNLRAPARVFMYAIDQQYHLHLMAACYAEAGQLRVQPTLATVRGVQMSPYGYAPTGEQWTWREGNDALLVIFIGEEPREARRACDNSGTGLSAGTIAPSEALHTFALGLKRYPDSPWASYLVEP